VDIDQRPDLAAQYGVTSVPTYIVSGRFNMRTHSVLDILVRVRQK
jgi:hypothetical protein